MPTNEQMQAMIAERDRLKELCGELLAALKDATWEIKAIGARDGAPQHINWDTGHLPMQTSSCTEEWWDALTVKCEAAIAKAEGVLNADSQQ